MPCRVKEVEFRVLAARALDALPDEFRRRMENVAIVVENYPSAEDADGAGTAPEELLGLFHGVSRLDKEWGGTSGQLPERVVLYKRNIEAVCSSKEELAREIRLTVLHEIGHYFGLSEAEIEKYEDG